MRLRIHRINTHCNCTYFIFVLSQILTFTNRSLFRILLRYVTLRKNAEFWNQIKIKSLHIETGEFGKSILEGFIQQGDHPWRSSRGWSHMVQNHVTHISNSIKLEQWISRLEFHTEILRGKISQKSATVIFLVHTLVMGSSYCNVECTGICTGLNGVDPRIKILAYPVNCLTINVRELLGIVLNPSTKVKRSKSISKFLCVKFVVKTMVLCIYMF